MPTISLDEARARLSELMDEAKEGAAVVIERGDGTAVRLVPVVEPAPAPRQFGSAKGKIWMSDDFDDPLPEFEPYM